MSGATYRAAVVRLREAFDVLGTRTTGPCGSCGSHPDQRHRVADAITERLFAGDDPAGIVEDYARPGLGVAEVWMVAAHVRDADYHRHRVTLAEAARIDDEVWSS